jgi:hypothetical protein
MNIFVPMICIGMGIGGSASGSEVTAEQRRRVFGQSLDTRTKYLSFRVFLEGGSAIALQTQKRDRVGLSRFCITVFNQWLCSPKLRRYRVASK